MFIAGTGMTTALGLSTDATCAALRARLNGFSEVPYTDVRGQAIIGAPVKAIRSKQKGPERLLDLAVPALAECIERAGRSEEGSTALLIGISREDRSTPVAERPNAFLDILRERTGIKWSKESRVLPDGPCFVAAALSIARTLLLQRRVAVCIVGGVDSLLDGRTLRDLEVARRLKKGGNPDGLVPGEAACFTAWTREPPQNSPFPMRLDGLGLSEGRHGVLPGQALAEAMRSAFAEAGAPNGEVPWEITDLTGERELSVEHAIAVTRVFTDPQPRVHFWHHAMSLGSIGAAAGPCSIAWAASAVGKGYAPGSRVLCIATSDFQRKGAMIIGTALGANRG